MAAHAFQARLDMPAIEILPPGFAQGRRCPVGAGTFGPYMAQGAGRMARIYPGLYRFGRRLASRRQHGEGRSGGAALVLYTAELLPPRSLERIVLLSAGISSGYDLRPALRSVRGEIVSFHSNNDQLVLNWGTRTFGTLDRVRSPGAGLNGFVLPKGLDESDRSLYDRLVQIPWRPRMLCVGNTGGHLSTAWPLFLAAEVAPWVK